jgi:hypothetical protein
LCALFGLLGGAFGAVGVLAAFEGFTIPQDTRRWGEWAPASEVRAWRESRGGISGVLEVWTLNLAYADPSGVRHEGARTVWLLGGGAPGIESVEVRVHPSQPARFVASTLVDLAGSRWGAVALGIVVGFGGLVLFGGSVRNTATSPCAELRCAALGEERIAFVRTDTVLEGERGRPRRILDLSVEDGTRARVELPVGVKPLYLDPDASAVLVLQAGQVPIETVLVAEDFQPFRLTPAEADEVRARLDAWRAAHPTDQNQRQARSLRKFMPTSSFQKPEPMKVPDSE